MADPISHRDSMSSDSSVILPPNTQAALLLAARSLLKQHQLAVPTAAEILEATGATRSRAYELADALERVLPSLSRPVGRPARADVDVPAAAIESVMSAVIEFMQRHPACVAGQRRLRYSDGFRRFIVALGRQHADIPLARFAEAVGVPLGTLEDWRRRADSDEPATDATDATDATAEPQAHRVTTARIESILAAYKPWQGSFVAFCAHVRDELRIPYGRTLISNILEMYKYRTPKRRPRRVPDEDALRGAFHRFFPAAQWVGDGTQLDICINGVSFRCNLELHVDAADGGFVGASVRDQEDAQAVIDAYDDGVRNTDTTPLALLLDNRPSNHTPQVREALGDTMPIRATLQRPQNKAHVEGGFGLFQQTAPPLVLRGATMRELAHSFLVCLVTIWGRTINHRPRRDRGGLSRVQLYRAACPTPEQIAHARAELAALMRRQQQAYETRTARLDPAKLEILTAAFARLQLDDDGDQLHIIATYPRDAIVEGIAIFEAKRAAQRLPDGAGARYLGGIVRNLADANELRHLAELLMLRRKQARDIALRILESELDDVRSSAQAPFDVMAALLERALAADRLLDHRFWLWAIAEYIKQRPEPERDELLREATTHICLTYRVPRARREEAIRHLVRAVSPVV